MGTRVYIGRLPNRCTERDIERFLKGYGYVKEVMLKNGYGFVEFEDYRDAEDAVYALNGKSLLGERILLEHARGPSRRGGRGGGGDRGDYGSGRGSRPVWTEKYGVPARTEYRLKVENLSSRVSWQDLKDYMRQAGEVTYADANKGRQNEGMVEFASKSDMLRAIDKLDDTELNGRRIKLVEERRSRRSRSRSRSYSRSRSRSRGRRSRSRSKSRSRSRSRSKSRDRSPPKNKDRSKSRSRSKSRDRSRSKSRDRSRSKSRDRSPPKSKDRSRSRSRSPEKDDDNDDRRSNRENDNDD